MLIVIAIISIMSALIVINATSSSYSKFNNSVNKIIAILENLQDEAIYTNSVIKCNLADNNITCMAYKNTEWSPVNVSKIISWPWPKEITTSGIVINDVPNLTNDLNIFFYPTGRDMWLSVHVTDGTYQSWLDSDINGNFKINN